MDEIQNYPQGQCAEIAGLACSTAVLAGSMVRNFFGAELREERRTSADGIFRWCSWERSNEIRKEYRLIQLTIAKQKSK